MNLRLLSALQLTSSRALRTLGCSLGLAALCLSSPALAQSTSPAPASTASKPRAERTGGPTGVGLVLGDLDGLSLKYWKNPQHALQLHVGAASQLNSAAVEGVYQYHFRPIEVQDSIYALPFYVGGGARFKVAGQGTTYLDFGFVGVAGMSVLVPDLPIEIFVEASPVLVLYNPAVGTTGVTPSLGFTIEGNMGIHYYF